MFDRADRKSIVIGILTSMLVIAFVQPVMTAVWRFLSTATPQWIEAYSACFYKSAALGQRNWVEVNLITLLFGFLTGMVSGTIMLLVKRRRRRKAIAENQPVEPDAPPKIWPLVLSFIPAFVFFFHVSMLASIELKLITTFNHRITILAPHITLQEEREIKASWALMKNRADYQTINKHMETLAEKSKITLPPPLY